MTILFISYWGVNEGLSQATVLPHVEILANHPSIQKVILATIERESFTPPPLPPNVIHLPLQSKSYHNVLLTKLGDFYFFPRALKKVCVENKVSLIISRSSLAGAIAYLLFRRLKIPYVVESYEPHAAYMRESGVWSRWDVRYLIQKYFEARENNSALRLLPVAKTFKNELVELGIGEEKIIVMPCCIKTGEFAFSEQQRYQIRTQLKIPIDATVGIYVGKFGGIYYEQEAFKIFKQAFDFFGDSLYVILLTGYEREKLLVELKHFSIDLSRVHVTSVNRDEVSSYLSASDFAFSFYRKSPSMKFLSPIKVGEYWANGLPVLLESGIGDDAEIINTEGGGVVFERENMNEAFAKVKILFESNQRGPDNTITKIAKLHRDLNLVRVAYDKIITLHQQNGFK